MNQNFRQRLETAAAFLKEKWGRAPDIAVILGSGLSGFARTLESQEAIPYTDVPAGIGSSVIGHDGRMVFGRIGNKRVLVLAGRIHGFEGHDPSEVVHLPRSVRAWGCEKFLITNAAGSTRALLKPGQLVLIKDHINLTWRNPLTGTELFGGDRFPDVSDLYSKAWRKSVMGLSQKLKIKLKEGVYGGVPGPAYETAAEIRAYQKLGIDLCGMSTVWEVLALKQMKSEILGLSCVTNLCTGVSKQVLTHEEVLETTAAAQTSFNKLVKGIIEAA